MGPGSSFISSPRVGKISSSLLIRLSSSSSVPQPSGFPHGPTGLESLSSETDPFSTGLMSSPIFCFILFLAGFSRESPFSEPNVFAISDARLLISCVVTASEVLCWPSLAYSSDICRRLAIIAFMSSLVLSFFLSLGLAGAFCSSSFPWLKNLLRRLSSLSKCSSSLNSGRLGARSSLGVKNLLLMSFIFGIIWISPSTGIPLGSASSSLSWIFFLISANLGTYSRFCSAIVGFNGASSVEPSKDFLMSDTPLQKASSLSLPAPPESSDMCWWSCGLGGDWSELVDIFCSGCLGVLATGDFGYSASLKDDVEERRDGLPMPSVVDWLPINRRRDCIYLHSCSFS